MLTEATDHGTLSYHLETRSHSSVYASIKILRDVAKGIFFLHTKAIIHRALTTGSIHVTYALPFFWSRMGVDCNKGWGARPRSVTLSLRVMSFQQ